jgi:hypothetical protein
MTSTNSDVETVISVDSQALITSYNRNIRVVLLASGAFIAIVLYGYSVGTLTMLWVSISLVVVLITLWISTAFLLRSVFIDKSIETLIRKGYGHA